MADAQVTPMEVDLLKEDLQSPRFTGRELVMIKTHFGRSMSEVIADDASDEKFLVLAWLKLRRLGYDLEPGAMDDVVITPRITDETAMPDPTSNGASTTSPPSVTSGG